MPLLGTGSGTAFQQGTLANRPAAATSNQGYYYLVTDAAGGTLYQSTGVAWVQLAGSVNAGAGTFTGEVTATDFKPSGLTGATAASRYVGATASGAPASGTFAVGDFVIDQTAKVWICTVAGTPGTWTQLSGGNATSTGAAGSEPGSPAAGDLYLPNNGYYVERYSGSAWVPWGPIFPMTKPPVVSGWTWAQQGTSTATDVAGGGIYVTVPSGNAGDFPRGIFRSLPGGAWTITAHILSRPATSTNAFGLILRNSTSGNVTVMMNQATNAIHTWSYGTGGTAYAGSEAVGSFSVDRPISWWRIADDNSGSSTARTYQVSGDGVNWLTLASTTHTNFITPDQIGVGGDCKAAGGSTDIGFTLLSWTGA